MLLLIDEPEYDEPDAIGLLDPLQGRKFGDYEILEEIARGGMGVVYRARQSSLRREVALKTILAGKVSGVAERRMFQTEALAAAALHHPHIVPVYECGERDLLPYLAMRYVPGGMNIARKAAELRSEGAWKVIAVSMAQVAQAVAHAHERGVLHRDLKPSNILWDRETGPQVTDFGLAKLTGGEAGLTVSVHMLGSPGYMAPEQTCGEEITTATDVYGLGAVLYELLSGRAPFSGKSALDTARKVREESPPPLKDVPLELATVCLKCLSRLPGDRYTSAAAVAEEMARFSRGEPVLAAPLTAPARLWRWAQRKPAVASLLGIVVIAVLAGTGGVLWQWREAEAARDSLGRSLKLTRTAESAQREALQKAEIANTAQAQSLEHLRWQEMDQWLERGDPARALARAAAFLREKPEDWRAAMFAMSIVDQHSFPVLTRPEITAPTGIGVAACMSPDGRWIVNPSTDAMVYIYDAVTGKLHTKFQHKRSLAGTLQRALSGGGVDLRTYDVLAAAIGGGRRPLAVAGGDGEVTLRTMDGSDAVVLKSRNRRTHIFDLVFSADSGRLMGRAPDSVHVWRTAEPAADPLILTLEGDIVDAALSAGGSAVLVWNSKRAEVRDADSGAELLKMETTGHFRSGNLSPDGSMAALPDSGTVRLWDVKARTELQPGRKCRAEITAFASGGSRLLTGGDGVPLAVYDTASMLPVSGSMWTHRVSWSLQPLPLPWMAVSADGSRFATTGVDETVCVWNAADGSPVCSPLRLGAGSYYATMQLSPDGKRILTRHFVDAKEEPAGARIGLWRTTPVRRPQHGGLAPGLISSIVFSEDGRMTAVATALSHGPPRGRLRVTGKASAGALLDAEFPALVYFSFFSPDGKQLYVVRTAGEANRLAAWSLETGKEIWSVPVKDGSLDVAALSPDGKWLVAGINSGPYAHGHLVAVSTGDGKETVSVPLEEMLTVLRFAPGQSDLALTSSANGSTRLWNIVSGDQLSVFPGGVNHITSAAWSPDGRLFATAGRDGVEVWDRESAGKLAHLPHPAWLSHLEFSPDGARLATFTRDGSIRLWNPRSGTPLSPPRRQGTVGGTLRFSADGATFLVQDSTGFRFWDTLRAEPVTARFPGSSISIGTADSSSVRAILAGGGSHGARVLSGLGEADSALWTVEMCSSRAPDWFPDLLETLALMRMDPDGAVSLVPGDNLFRLQERIEHAPADEPFANWARRVLELPSK